MTTKQKILNEALTLFAERDIVRFMSVRLPTP